MNIKIRDFKQEDVSFVLDFWLKNYYKFGTGYKPSWTIFFKYHQAQIIKLNSEGKLICQIACLPDDEDVILGFAVYGVDYSLHYIGVKESFKRLGIAKTLLKKFFKDRSEITVSHWTKDLQKLESLYKLKYNPYRFYQ